MIDCQCRFVLYFLESHSRSIIAKEQKSYTTSCVEAIEILKRTHSQSLSVSYEIKGIDNNNFSHHYTASFESPTVAASRIENFMRNPRLISEEKNKINDRKISER